MVLGLTASLGHTSKLEKYVKKKTPGLFILVALSLGSAACDKSPLDVTGTPPASSMAPAFASLSTEAKSLSFNENFTKGLSKTGVLEVTGQAPAYATRAAVFAGTQFDGSERGYLRTIAADYNTTSFRADVVVTIPGGFGGNSLAYFGFGKGEPNCTFYCEPFAAPSIYARIFPDDFFGPKVEINHSSLFTVATALGVGGNGTHMVRITWNKDTHAITFAIMNNYLDDGEFVPSAVLGPLTLGSEFDAANSHIFIGGAGNNSFDNLHVVVTK